MTNLNPIKKKLSKADRKISIQDPSKLLAEFFNGVVIELDEEYKNEVLGNCPRIAIEAASEMGWSKYIGENGIFIGMKSFGASGPASDLYNHFNITSKSIIDSAKLLLK